MRPRPGVTVTMAYVLALVALAAGYVAGRLDPLWVGAAIVAALAGCYVAIIAIDLHRRYEWRRR